MGVGLQGFVVPLVFDVPYSQGLVVRGTQDILATWVEHKSPHPVVMSRLYKNTKRSQYKIPALKAEFFESDFSGNGFEKNISKRALKGG